MATHPTIMKLRLAAINKIITEFPSAKGGMSTKDAHFYWGQRDIVDQIRQIVNNLPKGYNRPTPNLKTEAKVRFLQWRENQAKAEWKTLSEAEQKKWEDYVTEGVEFGEIRERELGLEAPIKKGDRVVLLTDIEYLRINYPAGAKATVRSIHKRDVVGANSYMIWFDDEKLVNLNVHSHEIRKA